MKKFVITYPSKVIPNAYAVFFCDKGEFLKNLYVTFTYNT